jgi:TRAP-type C4-dicarboxylate transport system permease small subunit
MVWVDNATPELDAESDWRTIVAICSVLSALSIAVVATRLWIRHQNHGLAADDWMATLSMVFALLYSILCIVRMCQRLPFLTFPQHTYPESDSLFHP